MNWATPGTAGVHLTLQSQWNGRTVGLCEAGAEMTFHFLGRLIAHICKTRNVRAGIVGSGTVSNRAVEVNGKGAATGIQLHCRKTRYRNDFGRPAQHRLHEVW